MHNGSMELHRLPIDEYWRSGMTYTKKEDFDSRTLAQMLGLSQASCRKLARDGKIKSYMDGGKMMYDGASVMRYMEG